MKIQDILNTEDNKNIYLHKEGLFWRAYEYSAFAFVKNLKPYHGKKKFIKKVGSEIAYIGFPDSVLDTILEMCKQKGYAYHKVDHLITIELNTKMEGFEPWKNEIDLEEINKPKKEEPSIIEQIVNFPLAAKTPMEAQQFLYDLQMEINGNL